MDKTPKKFICYNCNNTFSIFKGTIFEHSSTDLCKWFYAIHLFINGKKGISGYQLQREIGVTYKCAWRILHKIREAMGNDHDDDNSGSGLLQDIVEADECYVGGKEDNKHTKNKFKAVKSVIFGMVQRNGLVKAFHVKSAESHILQQKIMQHVKEGSIMVTDGHKSYDCLHWNYDHKVINHSAKEYVIKDRKNEELLIHTNTIEGFWGTLKRGIVGIYHHVGKAYMQKYVDEFCFRYNNRFNGGMFDLALQQSLIRKNRHCTFIR
jgi:transposase-like protein